MLPLFKAFMRTPEAQRDARAIEAARQQTVAELEILDAQLKSSDFVGGAAFTMGDIALGCAVWRWMALPVERPPLIHLQRWFDTLATRAAYRKVDEGDFEVLDGEGPRRFHIAPFATSA